MVLLDHLPFSSLIGYSLCTQFCSILQESLFPQNLPIFTETLKCTYCYLTVAICGKRKITCKAYTKRHQNLLTEESPKPFYINELKNIIIRWI